MEDLRYITFPPQLPAVPAWLLDGMDANSTLTSVDNDGAVQKIARESLDLIFADAKPGKYEGLDEALSVVVAVKVGR